MALYFCTGVLRDEQLFKHYALNVPLYTHFTSPIRRYPDIIVHRLLASSLSMYLHYWKAPLTQKQMHTFKQITNLLLFWTLLSCIAGYLLDEKKIAEKNKASSDLTLLMWCLSFAYVSALLPPSDSVVCVSVNMCGWSFFFILCPLNVHMQTVGLG